MKDSTAQILHAALSADETVSTEQTRAAVAILNGNEPEQGPKVPEPYITLREAGKRLGISPCSLWRWGVPGHSLGGRRRFRLSEIESYLVSDAMNQRAEELRQERISRETQS